MPVCAEGLEQLLTEASRGGITAISNLGLTLMGQTVGRRALVGAEVCVVHMSITQLLNNHTGSLSDEPQCNVYFSIIWISQVFSFINENNLMNIHTA